MICCRYKIQNTCFRLICVYYTLFILGLLHGILYGIGILYTCQKSPVYYTMCIIYTCKKNIGILYASAALSVFYTRVLIRPYFIQLSAAVIRFLILRILYTGTNQPYNIQSLCGSAAGYAAAAGVQLRKKFLNRAKKRLTNL